MTTTATNLTAPSATTANDSATTVAITGIVALLARSQARRFAEQATPANADTAPAGKDQP